VIALAERRFALLQSDRRAQSYRLLLLLLLLLLLRQRAKGTWRRWWTQRR
jgi:hypothetical protein